MSETLDGWPVEDGWLMHFNWRHMKWVRYMRVEDWQARKAAVAAIRKSPNPEQTLKEAKKAQA